MRAKRGNPHYDSDGTRWQVVRVDTPEETGVTYIAPYVVTPTPPSIKALVDAARGR